MVSTLLAFHGHVRWLVLAALLFALIRVWWGLISKREWTKIDGYASLAFAIILTVQVVLGIILYAQPVGLAQVAREDFGAAMKVRDLRFFAVEHPFMMTLALGIAHLGSARARKVSLSSRKFRWAAICFTIAALIIIGAIPWARPLFRAI